MTANENNRRYLAEAWIDEDKDEEFKKSFLENLLNQLEHHKSDGSGFDADMLDGKHYCEISKEIDEKVQGFLRDFSIGQVHISNENGSNYLLGFDAIQLYIPTIDGYEENDKKLPWDENPRVSKIPTLMDVFEELYNQVKDKVNQTDYEEKMDEIDEILNPLQELSANISESIDNDGNINATTINGIQIYILSETAYSEIPQEDKDDITNLYIVKPDEEIDSILDENGDPMYPGGRVSKNTDVAGISHYYQFRITEKTDDETNSTQKWLQYRYEGASPERKENETDEEWAIRDEATWNDIAPTSDFIDNSQVKDIIIDYLANGDYTLNKNVIKGVFNQITDFDKFDTTSHPTQWLLRNFLAGAKYQNKVVTLSDNTLIRTCPNEGNSMYLDLDALVDSIDIENIINSKLDEYWKRIYPVGSIYMSMEETSPETLFGGRWEKIQGKFLLASNTSHPLGQTGGEERHKLTTNEIPSHTHAHYHTHSAPNDIPYLVSQDDIKANLDNYREWPKKVSSGGYHVVYAEKGSKAGIRSKNSTGAVTSNSVNTGSAGGTNPIHNNMPPYIAVNVWRRLNDN